MAGQGQEQGTRETGRTSRGLGRRGLIAALTGLGAAALAKLTGPGRAEAGHDGATALTSTNVVHLGVINDGGNGVNNESATNVTTTTTVVANGGTAAIRGRQLQATGSSIGVEGVSGFIGLHGQSTSNFNGSSGVFGESDIIGVRGISVASFAQSVGVLGFLTNSGTPFPSYNTPAGVLGIARAGVLGPGVAGVATNDGLGSSVTNVGVHGQSTSGIGVRGDASSGIGVLGRSTSGDAGVQGESPTRFAVRGISNNGGTAVRGDASGGGGGTAIDGRGGLYGVIGVASQANGTGFLGYCPGGIGTRSDTETGTGLMAVAGQSSGYAARLFGRVVVEGPFEVIGGPKNALVPHPDGSHRRMYCQEATEPWFEDFGEAKLVNGRATVRLDEDFDAVVRGDNYMVFLTPHGDCNGLYVAERRPHAFEVREFKGGTSGLSFSYRVVAKRKDIEARRMEKVGRPERPERLSEHVRQGPERSPAREGREREEPARSPFPDARG